MTDKMVNERNKFAEALREQVNYVEGFEPEKYLECIASTNSSKVRYYLPVNIKRAWFRAVHPKGKIQTSIEKVAENVIYAKCELFFSYEDEIPFHTEEASTVVFPARWDETGKIKEECMCDYKAKVIGVATSKALSNAGFGAQVEYLIEDFEAEFIDKSYPVTKTVSEKVGSNYNAADEINKSLDDKKKIQQFPAAQNEKELTVQKPIVIEENVSIVANSSPLVTEVAANSTTLLPQQATDAGGTDTDESITNDDIISEANEEETASMADTKVLADTKSQAIASASVEVQKDPLVEARNYIVPDNMASAKGKTLEQVLNMDPQFIAYLASKSQYAETRRHALVLIGTNEVAKAKYEKYVNASRGA